MELKWIEDFVSLSSSSSFSRAAFERNVTQSALSRRIRQLEGWLGVTLIDRTTYPVRMTPEGETFLPRAIEVVERLRQTRENLHVQYHGRTDVLSFATLNTLSLTFFPTWIGRMEAELGSVKTRFVDQQPSFAGNVSIFAEGQSDFLLTYAHPSVPVRLDPLRFDFHRLGQERAIPVCTPDRDGGPRFSIDGGKTVPYLSYGTASFFAQALAQLFLRKPLPLVTVYENAMASGLKAMALEGHGVAWIPESLMSQELRSGALVAAGDADWSLATDIRLYRNRTRSRAAIEDFWSALTEECDGERPLPATRKTRREPFAVSNMT